MDELRIGVGHGEVWTLALGERPCRARPSRDPILGELGDLA
jgi:hypothetical protein